MSSANIIVKALLDDVLQTRLTSFHSAVAVHFIAVLKTVHVSCPSHSLLLLTCKRADALQHAAFVANRVVYHDLACNAGTFPEAPDTFSVGGAPPGTSAVEVPVITSTAITGGGVPSPSAVALPPGSSQQTCQTFNSACVSSDTSSAPFEFTVTLTCLPGSTAQVCQSSHAELSVADAHCVCLYS